MPSVARIPCSFGPDAPVHHDRSKSRIARSRSVNGRDEGDIANQPDPHRGVKQGPSGLSHPVRSLPARGTDDAAGRHRGGGDHGRRPPSRLPRGPPVRRGLALRRRAGAPTSLPRSLARDARRCTCASRRRGTASQSASDGRRSMQTGRCARVAHLAEQLTCNEQAVGSIPTSGSGTSCRERHVNRARSSRITCRSLQERADCAGALEIYRA
ncbi:MAG: hypothetical protein V7636_2285 [Actinomycetota bacterium]